MKNYNIKIIRCSLILNENSSPTKAIGFSVQSLDGQTQIYHETVLSSADMQSKTDEQCVELAFNTLSSSIALSVNTVINTPSVVGSFYIPS